MRVSFIFLMALALGCASSPGGHDQTDITPGEILAGAPLGAEQVPTRLVESDEVLALNPEMRNLLDSFVDRSGADYLMLHELIFALVDEGTFGLEYDEKTRTAAETFQLQRGNCLSFSNLFVSMAREVGLEVEYQEVDIPPDWTLRDDVFVLNRHINVRVELGSAGEHMVDFNIDDFRTSYDRRTISDSRALAHFYSNKGVEYMQAGEEASALAYYRRALAETDLDFSPAWTNLGVLYMRAGHVAYAEAAFLEALKANPQDRVAMSNLVRLYDYSGNHKQADAFRKRVSYHRNQNPYYRFQQGRKAVSDGEYDAAIGHLKYAIRKKENEDQFYFLLGMAYLLKGDDRKARRWMGRAEEVAATDALRRNYSNKINTILSTPD